MNDEKEYRKRIRQEKEKLQEVEIFTSVKFVGMLKSITREITDGIFDNVSISWMPEAPFMGRCDRKRVEINAANVVTQSFLTWQLKCDSILGTLGHECGHYNRTNFELFNKYMNGILEGVWYPRPPATSNEQESVCLAQIKEYFQKKDKIALLFIKQTAGIIWNLLEDIYVEDYMCGKYPGSIRRGILQNRSRNGEWLPSLRKQIDMGYEELAIMTNLIAQYTLSGTINNWDGYEGKLLDVLGEVKPVVDRAVKAHEESSRFLATNQILLKIWEILYGMILEAEKRVKEREEEREENRKGDEEEKSGQENAQENVQENGKGQQEKVEPDENPDIQDMLQSFLSHVPQFLQKTEGIGKNKGMPTDEEWDAQWPDESKECGSSEQNGEAGENEETKEECVQEPEVVSIREIEADEQLMDLLSELAREKVMEQTQKEINRDLQSQMEAIDFEAGHREVQKVVKRSLSVSEEVKAEYACIEQKVKKVMKRLRASILPILKKKETRTDRRLWVGKQLDAKYMANPSGAIFQKRKQQGTELSAALVVLIDVSDSMRGKRMEYAKLAALCLYEFCRSAGIPITVYGHHTDGYRHEKLADETVFLHSCAEFEPDSNDRYRILQLQPKGSNRDGVALIYMGEKLLQRPEKHKILTIISDGFPNANYYRGEEAKRDLIKIKKNLTKKGVTFLAAAIGADKDAIRNIYEEAFLDISDIEKLPVLLSKQVIRCIKGC